MNQVRMKKRIVTLLFVAILGSVVVKAVADEVSRFTAGADQADDITLVALKALAVIE